MPDNPPDEKRLCPLCLSMQTILIRVERDKDKYQHRGRTTLYLRCTRCAQIQIVEE